ncbi:MAG: hypothetical protein FWG68_05000 [Defluviitaleaceae bacterium]|nr:hypothetical protein [Defluviitaleaceae bacterium]
MKFWILLLWICGKTWNKLAEKPLLWGFSAVVVYAYGKSEWANGTGKRATDPPRGRLPHLRILLLKHWGLDGRATEDGRPYEKFTDYDKLNRYIDGILWYNGLYEISQQLTGGLTYEPKIFHCIASNIFALVWRLLQQPRKPR